MPIGPPGGINGPLGIGVPTGPPGGIICPLGIITAPDIPGAITGILVPAPLGKPEPIGAPVSVNGGKGCSAGSNVKTLPNRVC